MKENDKVRLPNGRVGTILEVFVVDDRTDYLVEFETPEGPHVYDNEFFSASDCTPVESTNVRTKCPLTKNRVSNGEEEP